jgi:hypothetical protein
MIGHHQALRQYDHAAVQHAHIGVEHQTGDSGIRQYSLCEVQFDEIVGFEDFLHAPVRSAILAMQTAILDPPGWQSLNVRQR